ncbi:MAG: glycosyltransferase family 9 protein [Endomicrobia bacterium]|nr:glycosyltransferase family 9 protein [Endomicrobiia bacterium]
MKRILIRGPDTVGSFVLATPFFRELRRNFKSDYIVLCIKPLVYELARDCPYVDKIIVYNKNFFDNILNIIGEKFDCAFLLSGSFEAAFVSFLAGIKERIGYPHDHRSFLLTKKVKELEQRHYVDYILNILENCGCKVEDRNLEVYIKIKPTKYDSFFSDSLPVVGITYSSIANDARKWPKEYVVKLINDLINRNFKVILLGKHSDIILNINNKNFLNLINSTSLEEFVNILRKISIYVSVATGGIHLASALGIPVIGLYTPGDELGWKPYGNNIRLIIKQTRCSPCNQHKMKYCNNNVCLKMITPEEVLRMLERSIEL